MRILNERPNKGKHGRASTHSDSFKVQPALEYLTGDYSAGQIARKYNLPLKTVEYFVHWYRKNNQQIMTEEPEEVQGSPLSVQELKAWEKKLALAELKIAALEKVIAIANEEYRTDLKKKAAAR